MSSETLVAILDESRVARDTYAALLEIELGATCLKVGSIGELLGEVQARPPNLIIIGGRAWSAVGWRELVNLAKATAPGVPLIAIGDEGGEADALLADPVDAKKLLATVLDLLRSS